MLAAGGDENVLNRRDARMRQSAKEERRARRAGRRMHHSRIEEAFAAQIWKDDRTVDQQCEAEPTRRKTEETTTKEHRGFDTRPSEKQ